ncbi:MAG: transglutaminase domain-containing protein [Flavobacteriales bacterium]|nr:transglutaminase domain-containing protein [Flavobacteriales bacterium]MCB9197040.1 transglutaminase domain-containing protein [Flavobacteriales bacterium]
MTTESISTKYYFAIICFLFIGFYFGQTDWTSYAKKFPNDNGVVLNKTESVVIGFDKEGKIEVVTNVYEERVFLNDNCKYYLDESIPFSSFIEISNLKPEVHIPTDKGYKKTYIKDIEVEDSYDSGIFHDDDKSMVFVYKGLVKGGKTILNYQEKITDPHFFGSFYFGSYFPTENAQISITAPSDMEIIAELFGDEKDKIQYTKEVKGKLTTHTWKASDLGKIEYSKSGVSISSYATHSIFRIGNYVHNSENKYVLRDVNDLYEYYNTFIKELNKEANPELDRIADSIAAKHETEYDKVKSVFYWVQDNIKYVAFEDGMGGFVPREAKTVCDRRYGDCKDMASILYYMVNHIGAKACYTWIGSRDIPYTYQEVPTPAVDNHMICTYLHEDKPIFMDATGKEQPFGWPTSFIQGKQALIAIDEKNYRLEYVPVIGIDQNVSIDSVFVFLDHDVVKGSGGIQYQGYMSFRLKEIVKSMDEDSRQKFYKDSFKKGNNKSNAEVTNVDNLDNKDEQLKFEYNFDIQDYIKLNNDELYVNLFLKKYYKSEKFNIESEKVDIENDYKKKIICNVYFKIPDGYELTYLPENTSYANKDDHFGFEAKFDYKKEESMVHLEYSIFENDLEIKVEEFEDWNNFIKELNKSYSELLILKKVQ